MDGLNFRGDSRSTHCWLSHLPSAWLSNSSAASLNTTKNGFSVYFYRAEGVCGGWFTFHSQSIEGRIIRWIFPSTGGETETPAPRDEPSDKKKKNHSFAKLRCRVVLLDSEVPVYSAASQHPLPVAGSHYRDMPWHSLFLLRMRHCRLLSQEVRLKSM